jgi:hypothetical protein
MKLGTVRIQEMFGSSEVFTAVYSVGRDTATKRHVQEDQIPQKTLIF